MDMLANGVLHMEALELLNDRIRVNLRGILAVVEGG
jgi:hypothetical protein